VIRDEFLWLPRRVFVAVRGLVDCRARWRWLVSVKRLDYPTGPMRWIP
jgi:hypothetical protein